MKALIRSRGAASLAALALLAAGRVSAEPLFQVWSERLYLPPPPGTPTSAYELRYPVAAVMPSDAAIASDLQARAFPERLVVDSINGHARTIRFTTTYQGANALHHSGGEVRQLEDDKPDPVCVDVFATVQLTGAPPKAEDEIIARAGAKCPFAEEIQPHRQLIVEGLDAKGQRLFAVVSVDPRWSIHESVAPDGKLSLEKMGREPADSTYVDFRAPIDARLKKLRVWQIDQTTLKPKAIGDIPWTGVSIKP